MRFTHPALQLLALCRLASTSPCKPSSSVASSAATSTETESTSSATEISTAISAETFSSTISHDTTLTASETASASDLSISTTLVSTSSAEPTTTLDATTDLSTTLDETTTTFESETTSSAEPTTTLVPTTDLSTTLDETMTTFESETTSGYDTLVSTTTAEASTTTSAAPEIPSNRVRNPGFEDTSVVPWQSMSGSLSLSSAEFHTGSQSGYFTGTAPMSATMGSRQFIDPTWITPGKSYKFSAWVKIMSTINCGYRFVACGYGSGQGTTSSIGFITETGGFSLATVTCTWTQAQWEAGPSVQIRSYCTGLSFFVDDATLEEI